MTHYISTFTGKKFFFEDPQEDMIDIEDIAHALSLNCRFNGHTRYFYSVAQHSILASDLIHPKYALYGLLHDASEAYLTDVPKPIKRTLPDYVKLEKTIQRKIYQTFGLDPEEPDELHVVDRHLCGLEGSYFMNNSQHNFRQYVSFFYPEVDLSRIYTPIQIRDRFLQRFYNLST